MRPDEAGAAGAAGAGFTLIELLVVMSIVALLLALAVPRYFQSVTRAREAVLRENLTLIRDSLDKHYSDTGKYPRSLAELVTQRYLRKLPEDPITGSTDTWLVVSREPGRGGGVIDVKSGAAGKSLSGEPYLEW